MSTLSGVRHTVRRSATRTRRALLWTPRRYRLSLTAAVAVLVLVPVVSLLVRQPWDRIALGPAASGPAAGGIGNGLGDGLAGTATPTAGGLPGPDGTTGPSGSTGPTVPAVPTGAGTVSETVPVDGGAVSAPDAGPLDPSPLPVSAVLAVGSSTPVPSRSAGGGQTLSPGAATDRWKAQARTTAVRFTQAWLAGATASRVDDWVKTLDPWLDPASRDLVALTNLAQIPRTQATTVQLTTLGETDASAQVRLADGGRLDLELVWDGDSWRVTSYEPVAAAP